MSGENLTIKELFSLIAQTAGAHSPTKKLPDFFLHALGTLGDWMDDFGLKGPISRENAWTSTLYHWFDNAKAKKELGFNPKSARYSIGKSVDWIREQGLLKENKSSNGSKV